jgi:hypothetical protein
MSAECLFSMTRLNGGEDHVFDKRFARLNTSSSSSVAEPEPAPTQLDRDFFATEGTSDTRRGRKRPELGLGGRVRPWGCHKLGCKQYQRCAHPGGV